MKRHRFELWKLDGKAFYKCADCGEEVAVGDNYSTAWCEPSEPALSEPLVAKCDMGHSFAPQWAGTTCTICDGIIDPAEPENEGGKG